MGAEHRSSGEGIPAYRYAREVRVALYQCVRLGVDRPDIGLAVGALKAFAEHCSQGKVRVDTFSTVTQEAFRQALASRCYDLVGISSVSVCYGEALRIMAELRERHPGMPVLVGGAHITCLPETLPREAIAVLAEGEVTFLEVCAQLSQGTLAAHLPSLAGIAYWRDGELVRNEPRPLIRHLDRLPQPDRSHFTPEAPAAVFTIRGCPYHCDFCVNHILWQRKVRKHGPEWVIDDLVAIRRKDPAVKTVVFRDDIMMLFPSRLERIARLKEERPELEGLEFVVYGRVECVTPEIVRTLKTMGVKCILFGFESQSPRMLRKYKGDRITPQMNQRAIDICHQEGMKAGGNVIIGHPEETLEDLEVTYAFLIDNFARGKIQTGGNSILTPFPATPYWRILRTKYGIDERSFDWERLNELSYLVARLDISRDLTVYEWWAHREKMGMVYIGALDPQRELLPLMERYEPVLHRYLNL